MSAPAKVRIAMCQVLTVDSDGEGNFARIEKALAEAKQGGAQIACIPESSVLGWENPQAHRLAHPIPGKDADGNVLARGKDRAEQVLVFDVPLRRRSAAAQD